MLFLDTQGRMEYLIHQSIQVTMENLLPPLKVLWNISYYTPSIEQWNTSFLPQCSDLINNSPPQILWNTYSYLQSETNGIPPHSLPPGTYGAPTPSLNTETYEIPPPTLHPGTYRTPPPSTQGPMEYLLHPSIRGPMDPSPSAQGPMEYLLPPSIQGPIGNFLHPSKQGPMEFLLSPPKVPRNTCFVCPLRVLWKIPPSRNTSSLSQ